MIPRLRLPSCHFKACLPTSFCLLSQPFGPQNLKLAPHASSSTTSKFTHLVAPMAEAIPCPVTRQQMLQRSPPNRRRIPTPVSHSSQVLTVRSNSWRQRPDMNRMDLPLINDFHFTRKKADLIRNNSYLCIDQVCEIRRPPIHLS
ncbi:unnamed protein product [Prunus brigantina]